MNVQKHPLGNSLAIEVISEDVLIFSEQDVPTFSNQF